MCVYVCVCTYVCVRMCVYVCVCIHVATVTMTLFQRFLLLSYVWVCGYHKGSRVWVCGYHKGSHVCICVHGYVVIIRGHVCAYVCMGMWLS